MSKTLITLFLAGLTIFGRASEFDRELAPFLEYHCYDCHGDGQDKGGLAMIHLERYLEAARLVIETAIQKKSTRPEVRVIPANFREFRDLLATREDTLARNFVSKLLTFATGREMGFSDRPGTG